MDHHAFPGRQPESDPFRALKSSSGLRAKLLDRLPLVAADVLKNGAELLLEHDKTGLVEGGSPVNRLEFIHNGAAYLIESRTIFPSPMIGSPGLFEFLIVERPTGRVDWAAGSRGTPRPVLERSEPSFVLRSVKYGLGDAFTEQVITWRDGLGPEVPLGVRTLSKENGGTALYSALPGEHKHRAFDALVSLERIDGILTALKSYAPFAAAAPELVAENKKGDPLRLGR